MERSPGMGGEGDIPAGIVASRLMNACDLNVFHYVCRNVKPRYAMTMLNYPGRRKIKFDILKVPDSFKKKPGEPVCVWRFSFKE